MLWVQQPAAGGDHAPTPDNPRAGKGSKLVFRQLPPQFKVLGDVDFAPVPAQTWDSSWWALSPWLTGIQQRRLLGQLGPLALAPPCSLPW